jgi:hypothetical protein
MFAIAASNCRMRRRSSSSDRLLCDVFVGGYPSLVRQRFMMDANDATVAEFDDGIVGNIVGGHAFAPSEVFCRRHVWRSAGRDPKIDYLA